MQKFIIKSPKNATYLSERTFENILKVLNSFTEEPLLKSLQASKYVTLFHDETTDVTNHSEAAVFAMFSHNGKHQEHYMGIINMKEGQTAEKFYIVTLNLCNQKGLDLAKVQFSDLDGCNTNSGKFQGFKLYFCYHNPHHLHQVCNSHTLALIPQHKVTESRFRAVRDADKLMISLYVLFKSSSVRLNIFERSQIVLEEKVLKIICPSATRWLTHEQCFSRIMEVYEAVLTALAQLYEERGDVDAQGILLQLSDPRFVLTALMLVDMLAIIRPLTLWLQFSPATADVTQLSFMVANVVDRLKYIAGADPEQRSKFTEKELKTLQFNRATFEEKCNIIDNQIESLPAATRLRNSSQRKNPQLQFEEFRRSVQKPFVTEIAEEIATKIRLDPVSAALQCLDVSHFPRERAGLAMHGVTDIKILCDHFGEPMEARHPQTMRRNRCDPKIDKNETVQEYEVFKVTSFDINSKRSAEVEYKISQLRRKLAGTLTIKTNRSKIEALKKEIAECESKLLKVPLAEMFEILNEPGRALLLPNILILLEMAILCPVGNATVERLFSFLKLVKTRLRNQLGDSTLDSLLRIKMESKEELEDTDLEQLVNMFKEYLIDLSKSGEIRIDI